jgi:hypothetical protein
MRITELEGRANKVDNDKYKTKLQFKSNNRIRKRNTGYYCCRVRGSGN